MSENVFTVKEKRPPRPAMTVSRNAKLGNKCGVSWFSLGAGTDIILITNKTVDKKSSHNPYMQDYARFFVQFLIGS